MTPEKVQLATKLMRDPHFNVQEICQELAISRATFYRYVSPDGEIRIEYADAHMQSLRQIAMKIIRQIIPKMTKQSLRVRV